MYASSQGRHVPYSWLFRRCARAGAIVLFVGWLSLVIVEAVTWHYAQPSIDTILQGLSFVVVFAGYAIGWRWELAGGVIAVLGTLVFFAVHLSTVGGLPGLAATWFAAPGVLYLLSWYSENVSPRLVRQR